MRLPAMQAHGRDNSVAGDGHGFGEAAPARAVDILFQQLEAAGERPPKRGAFRWVRRGGPLRCLHRLRAPQRGVGGRDGRLASGPEC